MSTSPHLTARGCDGDQALRFLARTAISLGSSALGLLGALPMLILKKKVA